MIRQIWILVIDLCASWYVRTVSVEAVHIEIALTTENVLLQQWSVDHDKNTKVMSSFMLPRVEHEHSPPKFILLFPEGIHNCALRRLCV